MPITVNEGGTLYELDTVTSNEGGTLYELDTVHSNESGVLYEIHSGTPQPISGHIDCTSGNPETVGSTFKISKSTTVTAKFTNISYGGGTSSQEFIFQVVDASSGNVILEKQAAGSSTSRTYSETIDSAGQYYIAVKIFSITGSQSGTKEYWGSCDYQITFA